MTINNQLLITQNTKDSINPRSNPSSQLVNLGLINHRIYQETHPHRYLPIQLRSTDPKVNSKREKLSCSFKNG